MIRGLRWWRRSPWRGGPARRRCGPGSAGRRSCAVAGSRRLWGYRRAQSLPTAGLLDQLAERAFRAVEHPLDHYGRGLIRTASSSAVFTALQPRRSGSARSISASNRSIVRNRSFAGLASSSNCPGAAACWFPSTDAASAGTGLVCCRRRCRGCSCPNRGRQRGPAGWCERADTLPWREAGGITRHLVRSSTR